MGNQINWMTCSVSHCRDVEEAKAAVCLEGIRQKQKLQHVLFCVRLKFTRGVSTGTLLVKEKKKDFLGTFIIKDESQIRFWQDA